MNALGHVLRDTQITYLAKAAFALRVTDYTSREEFLSHGVLLSWVGRDRLAAELGTKPDSIRLADKLLCAHGYMALDSAGGGYGQTNRYAITQFAEPAERRTPRKRGVIYPPTIGGEQTIDTPPVTKELSPRGRGASPPDFGGGKPLRESIETQSAVCGDEKGLKTSIERVLAALPKAPREGSSDDLIRSSVLQLVAGGIEHRSLAIAVERYCAESHYATEERGRFMGRAHTWLNSGAWKAHWPTPEGAFIDGLSAEERAWLADVRRWKRRPSDWQASLGPKPDQPACRVPARILEFCGLKPPLAEAS